jgi:hypothetical protein
MSNQQPKYWDIKPRWTAHDYAIARWVKSLKSRGGIANGVAILIVYNPYQPSRSPIVKEFVR